MPDLKKTVEQGRETARQGQLNIIQIVLIIFAVSTVIVLALGAFAAGDPTAQYQNCTDKFVHIAASGDTLAGVAAKYGTSQDKIRNINGDQHMIQVTRNVRTGELVEGNWLYVPCPPNK